MFIINNIDVLIKNYNVYTKLHVNCDFCCKTIPVILIFYS